MPVTSQTPFGPPPDLMVGVYRGTVEIVDDPEQRKRYRVRVANIHPPEVPSEHLPWAELGSTFAGGGFGDIPGYEIGDPVIVMFEGGDRRFPWIMGGVLNREGGLPPSPNEQIGNDYATLSQQRWTRTSRKGLKLELSDKEDELWVRIISPDGSEVRVSEHDGSILLNAEGRVNIIAPAVNIQAAESVTATADVLTADVVTTATVRCGDEVNIRAANRINIGEYQPAQTGLLPTPPETTTEIVSKATDLYQVSCDDLIDIDAAGALQVDAVGKITIHGQADIDVIGDANVFIDIEGNVTADIEGAVTAAVAGNVSLDVEGTTLIDSAQKITVTCAADIEVTASSAFTVNAASTITLDGGADLSLNSVANMDIDCGAVLTLSATSQVKLEAPVVTLDATSTAEMLAGDVCRMDGGVNLIG